MIDHETDGPPAPGAAPGAGKGDEPDDFWHLRLYVAGQSPKSLRAFANLKTMCEAHLRGRYEIEIVDLIADPALARSDDILAIPTLVRRLPPPLRRIIGDLSHERQVLQGLELPPRAVLDADER